MIGKMIKKVFGTKHEREMRRLQPLVQRVKSLEEATAALNDDDLAAKTAEFRRRLDNGESLDALLPEAFATVRETSRRVLGMRHYDVQILGGIVLHQGKIAEMKTGEGKTLVATCPMYLNALEGEGAHLVTVNDYLASRDADWMGRLYNKLGLSVGKILADLSSAERQRAYGSDITYGTNNEFGFDYLRDNMKYSLAEYAQRAHHYAIVDEVDSILIDEARTPLIISGAVEQSIELYYDINKVIPFLKKDEDYIVDEKHHSATLTEEGIDKVEKHLGVENLYEPSNIEFLHHVNKALQAHTLYKRDVNYIVHENKVVIVDEFTGRPMPGRRWSDGLHQAVEAKEGVSIQQESQTLATITFQNYFRMYNKLAGMTGTADTEAEEFKKIYELDTVVIPTNRPIARLDQPDVIYRSEGEKIAAAIDQIEASNKKGQPVLVGTVSVEKSEVISKVLRRKKIPHTVLNAKHHGAEASVVAQAGRQGSVTIATNMAGRGTDIVLGGNADALAEDELAELISKGEVEGAEQAQEMLPTLVAKYRKQCAQEREDVLAAGGLFILATERHESRRIDNQLRGRAGRQGDPGESRFYLSLEDDLMRIFGADRIGGMMDRLGMEPGVPIEHPLVTKAIGNAQRRVEGRNFDIRKNLLEYDDVMNQQRKAIYDTRRAVLEGTLMAEMMLDLFEDVVFAMGAKYCPEGVNVDDWDQEGFFKEINDIFFFEVEVPARIANRDTFLVAVWEQIEARYNSQQAQFQQIADRFNERFADTSEMETKTGADILGGLEQRFYLREIDQQWRDHLNAMSALRDSVSIRGYGQKDPKQEYKKEGYNLFVEMLTRIKVNVARQVFRVQVEEEEEQPAAQPSLEMAIPSTPLQIQLDAPEFFTTEAPPAIETTESTSAEPEAEDEAPAILTVDAEGDVVDAVSADGEALTAAQVESESAESGAKQQRSPKKKRGKKGDKKKRSRKRSLSR